MFELLKNLFDQKLNSASATDESQRLKAFELAGAALMVELMESDYNLDSRESREFDRVLQETFGLAREEVDEIVALARQTAQDSTSLYEFTRLINDNYSYEDKVGLIQNLWRLAFADDDLDKYEESLIRQIADLIYVSHSDFIQAKLRVRGHDS
ncbi:MAG: TerB family tellurite resistance protein [Pseudomonadales bacterium]|nr:TerB family tellurite resistance protein [Pseudomonadales bacterium]